MCKFSHCFICHLFFQKLENLIAIHLFKKFEDELYFYQDNIEVDFYLPIQSVAIQVCYNLIDANTYNREVQALCKFDNLFACKRLIIITYDKTDTLLVDNKKIELIAAWQFLLTKNFSTN